MGNRAAEIFERAVERPAPERAAILEEECRGDERLRSRVEVLLRAHEDAGAFLGAPTSRSPPVDFGGDAPGAGAPGPFGAERPGSVIGRFRLLELIGEGGFGRVFMAEQREPVVRRVAVKIIKLGMDTAQVVARFEAERQALALMDHPGIATVLDGGATESGRPYFVMELVKGVPITEYCDKTRLNVSERLALFMEVCAAVQHAHQKGVIHRDLKPGNVLVAERDGRPRPKVIDFGIAKATSGRLTNRTLFTEFRQFIGTPQYMSPEQTLGAGVDVDTRTDIYSLGVILYELLTGTTPLDPDALRTAGLDEVQRLIREGTTPRPSTRISTLESIGDVAAHRHTEPARLGTLLRGDLDWIVLKAVEKDRTRRYETANALADDVRRFLRHEPVSATPPSPSYRLRKFIRRNRGGVLAGAAVLLLLVVAVAGTTSGLLAALRERERAQAQRENAERVAEFMADLLKGVETAKALGRDTTVLREMLDSAAARIESGELADSPEAELRLRWTIGQAYTDIAEGGAAQRAEAVLRPAMGLAERTYGAQSIEAAMTLLTHARSLFALGQREEALSGYEASLQIYRRVHNGDHVAIVAALNDLVQCLESLGRPDEGLRRAEEAVAMSRRLKSGDDPALAASLNNVGACLSMLGRSEAAVTTYREALEMHRRLFGPDHPEVAACLNNLALCLSAMGRWDEALPAQEAVLQMHRRLFQGDHPDLAWSLNNVAYCLNAMGRYGDALPYFESALEMRQRLFTGDHPDTATNLNNVAACLNALGRHEEALAKFEAALAMFRALSDGDRPNLANTMHNMAGCLNRLGRGAEALSYAEAAIDMNRRMLPPDHLHILLAQLNRARALTLLSRFTEAESVLLEQAPKLLERPDLPAVYKKRAIDGAVALYEAWHAADPERGFDRKAAEWRERLEALRSASGKPNAG